MLLAGIQVFQESLDHALHRGDARGGFFNSPIDISFENSLL
jgi:hypothetical protein